jgi:hypothetical protein
VDVAFHKTYTVHVMHTHNIHTFIQVVIYYITIYYNTSYYILSVVTSFFNCLLLLVDVLVPMGIHKASTISIYLKVIHALV